MPRKMHVNEEIVFVDSQGVERRGWVAEVREGTVPPTIDVSTTPVGGPQPHPADAPFVAETYRVPHESDRVAGRAYWREVDEDRPMRTMASRRPVTDQPDQGTPIISANEAKNRVSAAKEALEAAEGTDGEAAARKTLEDAEATLEAAKAHEKGLAEADKAREAALAKDPATGMPKDHGTGTAGTASRAPTHPPAKGTASHPKRK